MFDSEHKTQTLGPVSFAKWMIVIFVGHAMGSAVFIGLAGVVLTLPARKLLEPYTLLLYCGLVLSPLLWWARLARQQPKSCAIRFGIVVFLHLQIVMLALGFSTIRLGILSQTEVLNEYAPVMEPFTALTSVAIYVVTRQILTARGSGRKEAA